MMSDKKKLTGRCRSMTSFPLCVELFESQVKKMQILSVISQVRPMCVQYNYLLITKLLKGGNQQ